MKNLKRYVVFTDGGARGNPGPAAVGAVIKDEDDGRTIKSYGESIGQGTNNEAEYRAVILVLQKMKLLLGKKKLKEISVDVNMDSELVVKQLNGEYKIEEERLFPLFIKVWNLKIDFEEIKFHHIPREKNKEADRLVNEALDKVQPNLF